MSILVADPPPGTEYECFDVATTQTLHVVIAENQAAQRAVIRDVLVSEIFAEEDIEIHEAVDALEARETIDALRSERQRVFCLIDLHMDETGERPELNGDALLEGLIRDSVAVPFAICSGTIAHERARLLQQGFDGLTFVEKGAFSPAVNSLNRELLTQRVRRAADESDVTRVTTEQLVYLQRVVKQGMNVPRMHLLVDTIQSEACRMLQRHRDVIENIERGTEFFTVHGLYNGDASQHVHEHKNALNLFIERIKRQAEPPMTLLRDLTLFQSLINNLYSALVDQQQSVDVASVLRDLCNRLTQLSGRDIHCKSRLASFEVPGDPMAMHHLLSNILQNAVVHGCDFIEIDIDDKGTIIVRNEVEELLPFRIIAGEVEGVLPVGSTATGGSGTGIAAMRKLCDELGFEFGMYSGGGSEKYVEVFVETNIVPRNTAEYKSDVPEREPRVPYGHIGFICHDEKPRETFQDNEGNCPEGCAFRYIDLPGIEESILRDDDGDKQLVEYCVEQYDEVFRNMSVCFIHDNLVALDRFTRVLCEQYPHLSIVPVSHEAEGMKGFIAERIADKGSLDNPNILTLEEQLANVQPDDPATVEALMDYSYRSYLPASVLQTIVAIARRRALKQSTDGS